MEIPFSIAAKMIEFMAKTILGKRIALSLDEKKHACEVLTRLYFCIAELEGLTHNLLETAQESLRSNQSLPLVNQLVLDLAQINANSRLFLDIVQELDLVMELYDPDLATTLSQLCAFKFGFLLAGSAGLVIEPTEDRHLGRFKYRRPSDRMLALNIEAHYQWIKEHPSPKTWPINLEWPQSFLVGGHHEEDLEEGVVELDDTSTISAFINVLKPHFEFLGRARTQLRKLIIDQFKIEDVLYVSHRLRRKDMGLLR